MTKKDNNTLICDWCNRKVFDGSARENFYTLLPSSGKEKNCCQSCFREKETEFRENKDFSNIYLIEKGDAKTLNHRIFVKKNGRSVDSSWVVCLRCKGGKWKKKSVAKNVGLNLLRCQHCEITGTESELEYFWGSEEKENAGFHCKAGFCPKCRKQQTEKMEIYQLPEAWRDQDLEKGKKSYIDHLTKLGWTCSCQAQEKAEKSVIKVEWLEKENQELKKQVTTLNQEKQELVAQIQDLKEKKEENKQKLTKEKTKKTPKIPTIPLQDKLKVGSTRVKSPTKNVSKLTVKRLPVKTQSDLPTPVALPKENLDFLEKDYSSNISTETQEKEELANSPQIIPSEKRKFPKFVLVGGTVILVLGVTSLIFFFWWKKPKDNF